ncbi:MAG TPA: alpha/beta hydrolase [Candidatus Saccharimonadales bacterium]
MPVALAPKAAKTQYVAGTFCSPFKFDRSRSIDVLVHGFGYDRTYWDSAFNYPQYSYVNRTLQAGRAVFYYDRLGVGKSGQLPSTSVTMNADAYVVHQIIQRYEHAFHQVNLVGHSYGSRISALETSQYNDATRLILTDNLHAVGPALVSGQLTNHPANQDALFAGRHLDDGWITTDTLTAREGFYDLATADPAEIAYDFAHKAIGSMTEFTQGQTIGAVPAGSNVTNSITRPVLLIVGEQDRLYCGLALDCTNAANVKSNEAPYYTAAASLTVKTVPDTGHDLTLHPSAGVSFDAISDWIEQ